MPLQQVWFNNRLIRRNMFGTAKWNSVALAFTCVVGSGAQTHNGQPSPAAAIDLIDRPVVAASNTELLEKAPTLPMRNSSVKILKGSAAAGGEGCVFTLSVGPQ